jgi:hypothetical protein
MLFFLLSRHFARAHPSVHDRFPPQSNFVYVKVISSVTRAGDCDVDPVGRAGDHIRVLFRLLHTWRPQARRT